MANFIAEMRVIYNQIDFTNYQNKPINKAYLRTDFALNKLWTSKVEIDVSMNDIET